MSLEIETKIGKLVAEVTEDPNYPSIDIFLERRDGTRTLLTATEVNQCDAEGTLRTDVFGELENEEPSYQIDYELGGVALTVQNYDLLSTYADMGFKWSEMQQVKKGIDVGLSEDAINLYAKPEFNAGQMAAIRVALKKGISMELVRAFAKPEFDREKMLEIYTDLQRGLSMEQVSIIANPDFDLDQMAEVRNGFEHGLTIEEVALYADSTFRAEQMEKIRWKLEELSFTDLTYATDEQIAAVLAQEAERADVPLAEQAEQFEMERQDYRNQVLSDLTPSQQRIVAAMETAGFLFRPTETNPIYFGDLGDYPITFDSWDVAYKFINSAELKDTPGLREQVQAVLHPETVFPYNVRDTVYLEDGKPFVKNRKRERQNKERDER